MNQSLFNEACDYVINSKITSNTATISNDKISSNNLPKTSSIIGTLGEKTVHSILKNYLEPNQDFHEVKIENFYADIFNKQGIIEIQTSNFDKLRKKLDVFLEMKPVTIVYPIPHIKKLSWINKETGEVSTPRKSTKTGKPYHIFRELYKIKKYLTHPNLTLHIILIDMEEYSLLDGWSADKKKGATKCDRIPTKLVDEIIIRSTIDYKQLLPDSLTKSFTVKDYKNITKISQKDAWAALNILNHIGTIHRIGKKGNAYLYSK